MEEVPLAIVVLPEAKEVSPTFVLFHSVPLTVPALNAPFAGIHISLVPAPVTGVFPFVPRDKIPPATSNEAIGSAVPIPTCVPSSKIVEFPIALAPENFGT